MAGLTSGRLTATTVWYNFTWLHEKAAKLSFGSFDVRLKVAHGKIVHVETIPGTEREGRSLQETVRPDDPR